MPSIINNTYFVNDLEIPKAIAQPSIGLNTPTATQSITDCIAYTEKDVLLRALGFTLYNELQTALPIIDGSLQKWKDLVNGVGKWEGLNNSKSLLAYATYYNYLLRQSDYWATTGVVKAESANATNVTPAYKLAYANQVFINKYQGENCKHPYFANGIGWEYKDWYGTENEEQLNLYTYLRDNSELYGWEASKFRFFETVNTFGL